MIMYTTIPVGRPPLRLYIVALVEATLVHFIISSKITNSITKQLSNSIYEIYNC